MMIDRRAFTRQGRRRPSLRQPVPVRFETRGTVLAPFAQDAVVAEAGVLEA
jgi:hypothetical protein